MKKFKISNFDIGMPAVLLGAGILTLIICLFLLLPAKKPSNDNQELQDAVIQMGKRIEELENQQTSSDAPLETGEGDFKVLSETDMQIQALTEQMASVQKKIDYIDARQGNLEQRVVALSAAVPPKKADKPKQAKKPVSKTSAPKKKTTAKPATKTTKKSQDQPAKQTVAKSAKYHTVAAGETRYGIARKYGLSVAQLDGINGFTAKTVIQPGQKILIQK